MTATAALPARKHANRATSGTGVRAFNRLAATCLTLFALIWLVPFLWALITSLRPDTEITTNPVSLWSNHWTLHAYTSTLTTNPIGWWYLNSFIISTLSVILTVVVCSTIGFGLAHLRFRGKSVAFAVILAGLMLPTEALVLPQFMEFRTIHLLGTYWALILPALANPLGVFLMRQFILGLPSDLLNAARLDGLSEFTIYRRIVLPLIKPGLVILAVIIFTDQYISFIWPLVATTSNNMEMLTVGVANLHSRGGVNFGLWSASAVMSLVPIAIVFFALQRQFLSRSLAGALKQ